ncbi:MAG: HAD family hydrolase [Proteobacteria bacterium]|nr:HAD family hydrolase [Pseudomonadota bacterium]
MKNQQIPKAIIFDWDNTLVNSWPLIQNALNSTMNKMGKESWSLEKVKENTHNSMRDFFPKLFGDKAQEASELYQSTYKADNLERISLLPKAIDVIDKLREMGILLLVVSNKVGNNLRNEAKRLEVNDRFFSIIGAMDALYDKPSKEPVELALEGSDIDPKKDLVWFIGDTIVDIECAYNSSCQPILYGEGHGIDHKFIQKAKLDKEKPLIQFQDHQDILKFISSWK